MYICGYYNVIWHTQVRLFLELEETMPMLRSYAKRHIWNWCFPGKLRQIWNWCFPGKARLEDKEKLLKEWDQRIEELKKSLIISQHHIFNHTYVPP